MNIDKKQLKEISQALGAASKTHAKHQGYIKDMLAQDRNTYAANLAGGSRPMTAMDNPQIDLVTGMPIRPGGQANMNPNFIGGMANSNMPTTGMLAQEKYDAAKADLNNNGVTEDWEEAKAKKFTV